MLQGLSDRRPNRPPGWPEMRNCHRSPLKSSSQPTATQTVAGPPCTPHHFCSHPRSPGFSSSTQRNPQTIPPPHPDAIPQPPTQTPTSPRQSHSELAHDVCPGSPQPPRTLQLLPRGDVTRHGTRRLNRHHISAAMAPYAGGSPAVSDGSSGDQQARKQGVMRAARTTRPLVGSPAARCVALSRVPGF